MRIFDCSHQLRARHHMGADDASLLRCKDLAFLCNANLSPALWITSGNTCRTAFNSQRYGTMVLVQISRQPPFKVHTCRAPLHVKAASSDFSREGEIFIVTTLSLKDATILLVL